MRRSTFDLAVQPAIESDDLERLGGKAVRLAELERLGFRVPSWFAIPASAFESTLARGELREPITERLHEATAGGRKLSAACREIRSWIEQLAFPRELGERVERTYERHLAGSSVAVRSSSRAEDGDDLSFAGLHDSYLYVDHSELEAAIRGVWASAFTERAVRYRLDHDRPVADPAVAVVVQEMVDPDVSGVLFTVNPTTSDVEEVVISALYGAGEGLVADGLPADTYVVDKIDGSTSVDIADKPTQLVRASEASKGLEEREVADRRRHARCLDRETVAELAEAGQRLEGAFETPQDVEFAITGEGTVYFLQTRPVTTVDERGPAQGQRLVWDNSNIIESYSGVTTPMTFSFIEKTFAISYRAFTEAMGLPEETVRRNMPVYENMLGLVRGEVYYNLMNWYRVVRMFPGFEFNAAFMESMIGADESLDLDDADLDSSFFERFADLSDLVGLVARSAWNFGRIDSLVEEFESELAGHIARWRGLDFDEMSSYALMERYWEIEERIRSNWRALVINDAYVMVAYGLLERLCDQWVGDETGTLQNDLICGEGGIETKEASNALVRLAARADEVPELREEIIEQPLEEIHERLRRRGAFSDFVGAVDCYLRRYGARSMDELKLEEPTLRDRPAFLYRMIRNYLTAPDPEALDLEARRQRELAIRREAEERAFSALSLPKRVLFRQVLEAARRGVRNRENMRFTRTRIYGLVRRLFRAAGRNFADEGILEQGDDIFYLTVDEVWDFVKGTAVTTNLRGLVALRREEFARFRSTPEESPDDRFTTYGAVYHGNSYRRRPDRSDPGGGEGLQGTGCCSGEVTGPAKVIRSPHDDMSLAGEILVAERTDPGWVPLYPSASGVVIERGSVLSHSAIVAREMGLPTVVGVDGATDVIESGQRIRVDGSAGRVEILEGAEA